MSFPTDILICFPRMNRNPLPSIRRYASHYLWVPGEGYLRQQVVEVRGCRAVRHYPLPGEVEGVEWLPGVIVLLPGWLLCPALSSAPCPKPSTDACPAPSTVPSPAPLTDPCPAPSAVPSPAPPADACPALPADITSLLSLLLSSDGASPSPASAGEGLLACHLFPFDLTALRPVAGTRHRLLP